MLEEPYEPFLASDSSEDASFEALSGADVVVFESEPESESYDSDTS